ncbi:MAG: glycosyltransferase family 4 protein [Gemmataceae bacterium]
MRIAVINKSCRRVGGTESYLDSVIPVLRQAGHEISFWCETQEPSFKPRLQLSDETPFWCAEDNLEQAIDGLSKWSPDLLYAHGMGDPLLEGRLQSIAPGIFFIHSYYGACISGRKTVSFPTPKPCERAFGLGCLANYYPRRCGGLNPLTMWKDYTLQTRRLKVLARYQTLITHSTHMQTEYHKYGFSVEKLTYYASVKKTSGETPLPITRPPAWRLLFLSRFDRLKGGSELLEALPQAYRQLGRAIHLTMAGDGPYRNRWQAQALALSERWPDLTIDFPGWVSVEVRDRLLAESHLLVVPSLWPEPFGRVGPEAGSAGLPVVAYDVGGVREWLIDGENGILASGKPPTSAGFGEAIARALSDLQEYEKMRSKAKAVAGKFTMANHMLELEALFERTMREKPTV